MQLNLTPQAQDIVEVLALMVLADKRVFSEEISTLLYTSIEIISTIEGEKNSISHARLLAWFDQRRADMRAQLGTSEYQDELAALIQRLASFPGREELYKNLVKIAQVDNEVHISEKALLTLAERCWKISPSA